MKLIDLHKKWAESGELNRPGLCHSLPEEYKEMFRLFYPSILEAKFILGSYWGAPEFNMDDFKRLSTYTPTRQHIVLFICAMMGEI